MKTNKVVSLRGTHGSGKSTVVFRILAQHPNEDGKLLDSKGRSAGKLVMLPGNKSLYIVGRYETQCGGCDGIQPYSDIWPRIEWAEAQGYHVLFEGALVSSSYGNIGRATEMFRERMIFAFLDTPLDVCLERIRTRREAKGNFEPVNPANTEFKFTSVTKSVSKIRDEFGRNVAIINHKRAVSQVIKLFAQERV